jgi:PAP2 superfamily
MLHQACARIARRLTDWARTLGTVAAPDTTADQVGRQASATGAHPSQTDEPAPGDARTGEPERRGHRDLGLRWWKELAFVAGFYLLYTVIRDTFGSASVGTTHALHNAERVIDVERDLGIFREQAVQQFFLRWPWFIRVLDVYYGSLHFIVPIVVLVVLFRSWPEDYRRWRNTLAATTALALIGFSLFPLMPPRLLCDCAYGAGAGVHYGFVDTLARFGGSWSFDSGAMKDVSNQYAAMPSLHMAWSLWCACVLVPRLRHGWAKALAAAYPMMTLVAIVVTANHYFLDAVGGALTLLVGYLIAQVVSGRLARRPVR